MKISAKFILLIFCFFINPNQTSAANQEKTATSKEDPSLYFKNCLKNTDQYNQVSQKCFEKYRSLENSLPELKNFNILMTEITGKFDLKSRIALINNSCKAKENSKSNEEITRFLKLWSSYGLWNYKEFNDFSPQKEKARKELAGYYKNHLKIKNSEADHAAKLALDCYMKTNINYSPDYDRSPSQI